MRFIREIPGESERSRYEAVGYGAPLPLSKAFAGGFRDFSRLARKTRLIRETLVRPPGAWKVVEPHTDADTRPHENPSVRADSDTHRPVNNAWIRPNLPLLKPAAERPYTRQPSVVLNITRTSPERKTNQPRRIEATRFSTSCG